MVAIKHLLDIQQRHNAPLARHCRRVAGMAGTVARALRLDEEEVLKIVHAALVHDIGMLDLPQEIFFTPSSLLTDAEFEQYRRHPGLGEKRLMSQTGDETIAALVWAHHENMDGSGFPRGLSGQDIPRGARVLAVVDFFDHLVSGQIINFRMTPQEAGVLVRSRRGRQFDADVVDVFLRVYESPRDDTTLDSLLQACA